jgi:hypothetical protein
MRVILFVLLAGSCTTVAGQSRIPISVFDFVRVNNGLWNEALFYYENNWKVYRDVAMQRGYITSYQLL